MRQHKHLKRLIISQLLWYTCSVDQNDSQLSYFTDDAGTQKIMCWIMASDYGTYASPMSKFNKEDEENSGKGISLDSKTETADVNGYTVVLT